MPMSYLATILKQKIEQKIAERCRVAQKIPNEFLHNGHFGRILKKRRFGSFFMVYIEWSSEDHLVPYELN